MKKRKTFNDYFEEFRIQFSNDTIFYPSTFSDKRTRFTVILVFITMGVFITGDLLYILKVGGALGLYIMTFSTIPILFYIFIVQNIRLRKELKRKGYPRPKNLFEWDSEKLRDIKTRLVYKRYKDLPSVLLKVNIKITKRLIDTPEKNPFVSIEKFMEYLGKTLIGLFIAILVFNLNKDFTDKGLNLLVRSAIGLVLMYGVFSFLWIYMFKRMYFDKVYTKRERLKEYVFVLQNIILLRLQKKKK